jgi:hypothetical protein
VSPVANTWTNFIGYQLAWFVVVRTAGQGQAWIGILAAGVFIVLQLAVSSRRLLDSKLMATALVLGLAIDGGLGLTGWVQYAPGVVTVPPGGAPLWILSLWMAFSLTLTRSLGWLRGRPVLGMLLGAVGGPLAYLSASRGWDAVEFPAPAYRGVAGLAVGWGVAIPALLTVIERARADGSVSGQSPAQQEKS